MKKTIRTVLTAAVTAGALCICALMTAWAQTAEGTQWELLSQAYQYTFPLVLMDQTMKAATNTEEPDKAGHAPVNQLIHTQQLANADSKLVVTPNVDTVYTQAWLDLSEEPMVFIMPKADRFFQTQVLDGWTNTPAVLESGSYLIAKKGWSGAVPEGLTLVEVPTDMVWLISRILVNDSADMERVSALQEGMQLLPLSAYERGEAYVPPKGTYKEEYDVNPLQTVLSLDPQSYFERANQLMTENPPAAEDSAALEKFASLNIGPGMTFDASILAGDIQTQWAQMLSSMKGTLTASGAKYQKALGDWTYFGAPIGNYGTAYDYRALVALGGLGANPVDVAVYAKTNTDAAGAELSGEKTYTLHFDSLPPVEEGGFWSVTAYGSDDYLIANELGKYCINDRSDFVLNADGSLDIVLSREAPENQANWLPVGEGEFHLFLRIYLPDMNALDNEWTAPVITENGNVSGALEAENGLLDAFSVSSSATESTAQANKAWYERLDFSDDKEFENATRGLIEAPESVAIYKDDGTLVWSTEAVSNLEEEAPDTVNPSLWRNTRLNGYAGLFEVCDGIYQVRGYDMANVTFIRTDNGWIVFDVLMCKEDMQAALALMEQHFGEINVKAVLYSHSHVDHFGGVEGLISKDEVADSSLSLQEQLASGKVVVLAPEGFLEDAVSENVYAGTAMARRAQYQYGSLLEKGAEGSLSIGIGLGQSVGTVSLIAPTYEITEDDESITIDGLEIEFQLTPGTEAPAEMNAYFPKYKALWMAENCTGTMHNLYTLRGAQVRDASAWSQYILEADQRFGDKTDVIFQSHNWPHWKEEVHEYLLNTASVYKFIHDQTLHYINLGYTSEEISDMIELPKELEKVWYTRQYYGTLSHNVKAVYQKYIGWYDANPVNLNPLTPEETAKKLVEYLGDTDAVLEKARSDFEKGEYQWVAQITKELVYADPENQEARNLCADALEQLGYQAESGAWRNAYLTGAMELRYGNLSADAPKSSGLSNILREMTVEMLLDYIAIRTDANAAQDDDLSFTLRITDTGEVWHVQRRNGVLLTVSGESKDAVQAEVSCTRLQLLGLLNGNTDADISVVGDASVLTRLVKYCTTFTNTFNIIEP